MKRLLSNFAVLTMLMTSIPLAMADTFVPPTIPANMLGNETVQAITALYDLVNKAPVNCVSDCPSWDQTQADLTNAQSQAEHLLDTLDGQAKVMVPELTNLAINKNAFETIVLAAGGKTRSSCKASGALVFHFESLVYCFDNDGQVDGFLGGLANYGQNKPSNTPTRSFLTVLNVLTDLSTLSRQISSNLQAATTAKQACDTNVIDPRCTANRLKQARFETHDTGVLAFTDMQDHWAKGYVSTLFAKGIVKGRTATTFAPDLSITRAELLKMVIIATKRNVDSFANRDPGFSDVPHSHPLSVYVTYGRLQDWVKGSNGLFYPDRPVSSFEAIKIIFNAFGVVLGNSEHSAIPGVEDGEQARYIETARIRNLTTSPDMPQIQPNQPMTRANVARIIAALL